jgi:hypothetical protein
MNILYLFLAIPLGVLGAGVLLTALYGKPVQARVSPVANCLLAVYGVFFLGEGFFWGWLSMWYSSFPEKYKLLDLHWAIFLTAMGVLFGATSLVIKRGEREPPIHLIRLWQFVSVGLLLMALQRFVTILDWL